MRLAETTPEFNEVLKSANGKFVTVVMMCYDHYEYEYDKCLDDLIVYSARQGFRFFKNRLRATDVERGRYVAVREAFFGDYLLFIDSDQIFPPDTLERLVRHDKPIVGTIVVCKEPPHNPVTGYGNAEIGVKSLLDWPSNALIEVDATGMGCMLIKREVFEKFPDGNPFLKMFCKAMNENFGEDWSFCLRAKELGFPIYVDTSIPIGHKGSYFYTVGDYELYKKDMIRTEDARTTSAEQRAIFNQCMNPRVERFTAEHPKMRNVLWTPQGAGNGHEKAGMKVKLFGE